MIRILALALAMGIGSIGCQQINKVPGPDGGGSGGGLGYGQGEIDDAIWDPVNANPDYFASETVYFDFDSASVKASEQSKVDTVAGFLTSNPGSAVSVEGHCDERGTEEYNLALGERRAQAVREYLINSGVSPAAVRTLSFGEARPAVDAQNESAYAQNRRGEFVLYRPVAQ